MSFCFIHQIKTDDRSVRNFKDLKGQVEIAFKPGCIHNDQRYIGFAKQQKIAGNFFIRWEKGADGVWRMDRLVTGPRELPGTDQGGEEASGM